MEPFVGIIAVVVVIAIALISGFVSQYVTSARGHTSLLFFWVGLFFPIVGLLVAFLTPVPTEPLPAPKRADKPTVKLADQLDGLARRHGAVELTDDEYQMAKRRVLEDQTSS